MSNVSGFCQNCVSLLIPPPNHESSHSARAAELLCCNDPLLLSELAVFKYDVTEWESIVAQLQGKISQVQAFLDPLVAARMNAEARLKDTKSLLRPICHMPNEILMQIFLFCIPSFPAVATAYNALDSTTVPWTLTHVCQRWRNLARSLPNLWSYVKVDFERQRLVTVFKAKMKSVTGIPRDPPLAALGETQAKKVAKFFLSSRVRTTHREPSWLNLSPWMQIHSLSVAYRRKHRPNP
ncbi:hypothetical protein BDZ89DRAFT_1139836 [Hymenopellis radicata]|nr:hypothetical protein BDZ89DRAFT_1139836 [Hymenopellis radicata]